jgi:ubiquinone/menaquinone biosynthesis C-methylase UbiE
MEKNKRFSFEKAAKLDTPERLHEQPPRPIVDLISSVSPKTVLDLGVGTGTYAVPLLEALSQTTVIGLDVEPRMLDLFRDRAEKAGCGARIRTIEAALGQGRPIPLEDHSAEVVLMLNLYHELEDRVDVLKEIQRILAPGGMLVLSDPDPDASDSHGPPKAHRVLPGVVEKELAEAGYREISRCPFFRNHYTISART